MFAKCIKMQKWVFLAMFGINILQTVVIEAKLTVMPKTQLVSACVGDTVSLEVEISQSEGSVSITWTHGSNTIDDHDHYALGEGGKKLTILDVLPPHSGVYFAHVKDYSNTDNAVSFTVDVRDIFMRLLVKTPVTIPLGGKGTLSVSKSEEGALWWVHGRELVQTTGENSHYRILDSKELTGSVLEIYDVEPEHAGMYEAILKSGACEIRNLIQVNVGEDTTDDNQDILEILLDNLPIIAGTVVALILALFTAVCLLYARSRKLKGNQSEELKDSNNSKSDSPVKGITLQDPVYNVTEESIYGNIYDDPHALGEPEDNMATHVIYNTTEELYGDLGIYTGLNDVYGHT